MHILYTSLKIFTIWLVPISDIFNYYSANIRRMFKREVWGEVKHEPRSLDVLYLLLMLNFPNGQFYHYITQFTPLKSKKRSNVSNKKQR